MIRELLDALVARRLREAHIAAGMPAVASSRGHPRSLVALRYENGVARPSLDRFRSLAAIYDTTLAALLTECDEVVPLIAAIECADACNLIRLLDTLA